MTPLHRIPTPSASGKLKKKKSANKQKAKGLQIIVGNQAQVERSTTPSSRGVSQQGR